jgi:hexokinase
MEKISSGAYLGPLSYHIFKQAIRDGVLKFNRSDEFISWTNFQTKDLNAFQHSPLTMEGNIAELFGKDEKDALATVAYLTSMVTERGAVISAAVVAAAVERMGAGFDPFVPVRIAVEGTTFMIYKGMRTALESYLHIMLNNEKKRSYSITPVEQASLFGAAVAALSK